MSILGRILISSAERLDLNDISSIDSFVAGDFKYLIQSFVGDSTPYVLKGFDVIDPSGCIGTTSCTIRVADSVVYYPTSSAGSFFYGLPAGSPASLPLIPELKSSATNYIYLTFTTTELAADSRAFWDPDQNGGAGGEFSQEVNTESMLSIATNTSVSTFPEGTIPIAKVTTDGSGIIQSVQDCRDMMFRLGTGGSTPNPYSNFNFPSLPSVPYARNEPSTLMISNTDPNPFQGGDKNIQSLKDWMDAVMSKIKELSGTPYWYYLSPSISVPQVFQDALASVLKSKGEWKHDGTTPGLVTWTADITQKSLQDPHDIIIRNGSTQLADEQIAYITLIRDADINTGPYPVSFYNGLNYVNGILSSFQNLSVGDWIKQKVDTVDKYLRIENFYSGANLTGSPGVTSNLALSIKLNGNYAGATATVDAVYTKGIFQSTDVQVVDRNNAALQAAGGNMFWLVARSDVKMGISSVISHTVNGTITACDGVTATISATLHGLVDGDRLTLTGAFTGVYVVEIKDANTFTIQVSTTATGAVVGTYYICTTTARYNTDATLQLEDANHHFESNETVVFANSTYTNTFPEQVNYRSPTTFEIPSISTFSPDSTWTVSGVRVNVRKSFGSIRIVQGESIQIGEVDGVNIQKFIGMNSLAETYPSYILPDSYNTLIGQEHFNCASNDNLSQRAAKLTAMMADRVQDRGISFRGRTTIRNTTNGADQDITATNTIVVDKPKSASQTITLTCSLPANSAGIAVIDRNGSGVISVSVESLGSSFLLEENTFILFYRLSGNDVYCWDNNVVPPNGTFTVNAIEHAQNKNITVFYPAEVSINLNILSPNYNKVTFADTTVDLTIAIPGSSNYNTLTTSAVNNFEVDDGYVVWVRIDRNAAKIFNTLHVADAPDTTTNGAVYVTTKALVPIEQDVVVLYERIGTALLGLHRPEQLQNNVYEESIDVVLAPSGDHQIGAVSSGANISLPPDTRDNGNPQYYIYGSGQLEVFLNGQMIYESRDWAEVVGSPIASLCNQIQILRNLVINDVLTFRVDTSGSVYFANTVGMSFTMQDTYNAGRFITTNSGQPVVISGPAGEDLLQVNGNVKITGVIDPSGLVFEPQVSNPLTILQSGLWIDSSSSLMYSKTGSTINVSTDYVRRDGTLAMTASLNLNSHTITNLLDPVGVQDAATRNYTDTSSANANYLHTDGTVAATGNINANSHKVVNILDPIDPQDAATRNYTDTSISTAFGTAVSSCLKLDGTNSMSANLNANTHKVVNVTDPSDLQDAVTKNYSDNAVSTALGTALSSCLKLDGTNSMGANLNVNSHKIVNVTDPLDPQDAATKIYVDQPTSHMTLFVSIANNTGSTLYAGSVVAMSSNTPHGVILANANSLSLVEGTVGVVYQDILNNASGYMQVAGEITVLGGPFDLGKRVYVSAAISGDATPLAPTISGTIVYFLGVASTTSTVILSPNLDAINDNVYDESITYVSPISSGSVIVLPNDSRNSNAAQTYPVGEGLLEMYLNGQYLHLGVDWAEIGLPGASSNVITIQQDIKIGDVLTFRINLQNSAYFMSSSGSSSSLQTAYNNGRFITVANSQPIDISGTAGQKLLAIHGDIQLDGVIDPIGVTFTPQVSNPLPLNQSGIWVSSIGNLMTQKGDSSSPIDITAAVVSSSTPETLITTLTNNTGNTIAARTVVCVNSSGDITPVSVAVEANAFSVIGVTANSISNASSGTIVISGALKNITTSASFGDALFIAIDGSLTNVKPTIGVNGFMAGDFVIKVGIIVKDHTNSLQKNLIINNQIMGQL